MESFMPTPTKLRLNYSFSFPRLGLLSQSVRNHLIGASQVIRPMGPCPHLKESNLQQPSYFSFLKSCSFFLPPEVFILYSSLGGSFLSARLNAAQLESVFASVNS